MRVGGLLFLVVVFAVGIVSAFTVAYFTLDAKPKVVVNRGPTVKILVAKSEIAVGEEITAKSVTYQDVSIKEIPDGAVLSYTQVARRRSAFAIPVGCPICDDLLIPQATESNQTVRFIPAGSQVVVMEIEQVRLNKQTPSAPIAVSQVLSTDDLVDIRVVPRQESKGELIDLKKSVLKANASKEELQKNETGELVLENVPVRDVQSSGVTNQGKLYQTVSFLLENDQATILNRAAREGNLRISLHAELTDKTTSQETPKETEEAETSLPEEQPSSQQSAVVDGTPLAFIASSENAEREKQPIVSFVAPKSTAIKNEPGVQTNEIVQQPVETDTDYSPFSVKSRTATVSVKEPMIQPQPLPPRKRVQWN